MNRELSTSPGTWATSAGILMFFLASLGGIVMRVDPFVIVQRACWSAVIVAMVVRVVLLVMGVALRNQR